MRYIWAIQVLVWLLLLTPLNGLLAQDEISDSDLISRYADVPSERTEDGGFVLGDPAAPVTIVEFSDFVCPHCQDYEQDIEQIITDLVLTGKARFEYRMYPIVHPTYSPLTAQLAECADTVQPGMFWPAHDMLYQITSSGQLTEDIVNVVAGRLGLDGDAVAICMQTATQYQVDSTLAGDMGINGTPAVMVRQGNGDLQWLVINGETWNRGGVPFASLQAFVDGDTSITTAPPETLLTRKMLSDTSLVDEGLCQAPCWKGITPGETSWEDALAIVQNEPEYTNAQVLTSEDGTSVGVAWQPVDGDLCCQIISLTGATADEIVLQITPESTLGEVIEKHGAPAYLIGSEYTSKQAVAVLFFPDIPMILYVYIDGLETGAISESSEVIGVLYITTGIMDEFIQANDFYAWQGYQSYQAYAEGPFAEKP